MKIWTKIDEKKLTIYTQLKYAVCHTCFELDSEVAPMEMLGDMIIPALINNVEHLIEKEREHANQD